MRTTGVMLLVVTSTVWSGCGGSSCGDIGDSCVSFESCCSAMCVEGACGCHKVNDSCSTDSDCCANYGLGCFSGTCRAKSLNVGSICVTDAQCKSGLCVGWCTQECTSTSQCSGETICVFDSSDDSTASCFPYCGTGSNTSCPSFGAGVTCLPAATVEGGTMQVCGVES